MVPDVEISIVPKRFKSVVFPPPDGPLIITNSPLNETKTQTTHEIAKK